MARELLDWLNKYTFPEETKFANPQHGRRIARLFLDEMVRHGTTTVAAYCSVHKASAEAFFAESHARNMLNDRRQGDDGPQCAGGRARHAAIGL